MHINSANVASPAHMNFAAAKTPTWAADEKTLVKLFSSTLISEVASLYTPLASGIITSTFNTLVSDLKSGISQSAAYAEFQKDFNTLNLVPIASPYPTAAGDAIAKLINSKNEAAIYGILPAGTISEKTFKADAAVLKSGLQNGQALKEFSVIF